MAERNDIPRRDIVYTADDDRQLGEFYTVEAVTYRYVKFPAGIYVRKYDALNVDSNFVATPILDAQTNTNAIAAIDVDTISSTSAVYAMVIWKGNTIVSISGDSITCVNAAFYGAKLIPHQNGQMRVSNAAYYLANLRTLVSATTCTMSYTYATAANITSYLNVGDVINTNVGIYTTVGKISNASSFTTTATPQGIVADTSNLIYIISPIGGLQRANMAVTSANAQYKIVCVSTFLATVNVSSKATVVTTNSCVCGYAIKVGDVLNGPNSSTRLVTSINNAYAFTINAAMDTETSGNLGSVWNINAKYASVVVG